jgi:hypothetical protein
MTQAGLIGDQHLPGPGHFQRAPSASDGQLFLLGVELNKYYIAAGIVAIIVGIAHSVLGEGLVFRRMRREGVVPTDGGTVLQERHVRIIWACWHALTVLGWLAAAILFWLAAAPRHDSSTHFPETAISVAMLLSSGLVLIGTKGKHPGWIGFLAVAVLVLFGSNK